MSWSKKYFTVWDIENDSEKKLEKLLLDIINGSDDVEYRVKFAAYKSEAEERGTFTAYFTPNVLLRFPHLEAHYVLERCEMPDASSVKVWIGVEPLASQMSINESHQRCY